MGYVKAFILLLALLFFGFVALLAAFVAVIYSPITPDLKSKLNSIFIKPFSAFSRWLIGVKLVVLNREHLESVRPMIFFGNHQTGLDLAILGSICTDGAVIVGKKEIKNIPIFGWFWKIAGNLLIDRSNAREAKAQMEELRQTLISNNLNLAIFPEGTRSKNGEILPFKKGVFHLAVSTGLPMIPVVCSRLKGKAIWENFELSGGHVIISVLPPIETKHLNAENLDAFREEVRNIVIKEYERINRLASSYDANPALLKAGLSV